MFEAESKGRQRPSPLISESFPSPQTDTEFWNQNPDSPGSLLSLTPFTQLSSQSDHFHFQQRSPVSRAPQSPRGLLSSGSGLPGPCSRGAAGTIPGVGLLLGAPVSFSFSGSSSNARPGSAPKPLCPPRRRAAGRSPSSLGSLALAGLRTRSSHHRGSDSSLSDRGRTSWERPPQPSQKSR